MSNRLYYIATGKTRGITDKFFAERASGHAQICDFAAKFGASRVVLCGTSVRGLVCDNAPGECWRYAKRSKCWAPNKRTAAGRRLAKEMAALRIPDGFTLARRLGIDALVFPDDNGRTHISGVGLHVFPHADVHVLEFPKGSTEVPADCEPMKASDYWRLCEEQDEKRAAATKPG